MCQLCNDTLLASANAAALLARAAKDLYNINQHGEAATLAKAAADLFEQPKVADIKVPGVKPEGKAGNAEPKPKPEAEAQKKPAFHIDEATGVVYINGVAVGIAVALPKRS